MHKIKCKYWHDNKKNVKNANLNTNIESFTNIEDTNVIDDLLICNCS